MTDRLIHALSRQPVHRLVRPLAAFLLSVVLAFGGGLWLTKLNRAELVDGASLGQDGFVATWLRSATIALPLVFAAVWVGLLVTRKALARAACDDSIALGSAVLAVTVGGLTAMATALLAPVGHWLFPSSIVSTDMAFFTHLVRDGLAALPLNILLAGAVCAVIARRRPWAAPQVRTWGVPARSRGLRIALQGTFALAVLAPVALLAQVGTERAVAGAGPGAPCPVGAPTKSFSVTAIGVNIPLNRFGDHDTQGKMYALTSMIPAIRAQEQSRHVTAGLRDDPIQPLVIRANLGDCVEIAFANQAGAEYGVHIDGLAFDVASSGDAVGENAPSSIQNGATTFYRYYIPNDPELEGAHYIRPGPGNRDAVSHGLFGALVAEPVGSQYLNPDTGAPLPNGWGWEATIVPATGKAFRESNLLHHEIGDENYLIPTTSRDVSPTGAETTLPVKDPITTSYRPGSRALNYRSEPFMHRLAVDPLDRLKAYAYNSYPFGDPSTPIPRGYVNDPTKIRLVHAGSELFHVYHLHGGGDRWRANPKADKTWDYGATGQKVANGLVDKQPVEEAQSARLDSQSIGPGESYNLEIEGGAGGAQQVPGDFLFHCHIAEHYVSGMWSVWRVYDTKQPDFAPLPDRPAPPTAVDSAGLIASGFTTPNGIPLTSGNINQWVEPLLPPQGVPLKAPGDPISMDGAVWNWKRADPTNPAATSDVYFGEPEDKTGALAGSPYPGTFPNLKSPADGGFRAVPGHPGLFPIDAGHQLSADGRPRILFNPVTGRPTFPLLRTQVGQRTPFSPNGHTGAPGVGEIQDKDPAVPGQIDPWAGSKNGLCPKTSPVKNFNLVTIQLPNQVTKAGGTDEFGKVFVLAKNKDKVRNHTMPIEPLAIRANIGDCVRLTATSEQDDTDPNLPFAMNNVHIHHVQFDPTASDGATAGMDYGQGFRPYRLEDAQLAQNANAGGNQLTLKIPATADNLLQSFAKYRKGIWIAIGEGTEAIEVHQIADVVDNGNQATITLTKPLANDHATNEWAGTEFVKEIWYPDVQLDNIFWHDHVDGIHGWGHGLVGQLVIEPRGSTYHDPKTGAPVDSGTFVDVHTTNALAPGVVDGSFREFVLWTIDQNPVTDSTINIKAEPLSSRRAANPDPSLLYSSYTHGDPFTPLPRAYAGDPFVIRAINVSPAIDTLHIDGHKVYAENRLRDGNGKLQSSPLSAVVYGISERYTLAFRGGAGGPQKRAGDYLYTNGLGRRLEQGAWGLIRVLPRQVGDLQVLPSNPNVPTGQSDPQVPNGGRPPSTTSTGDPCPVGAPARNFAVSAVDVPGLVPGRLLAYVPTPDAPAVKAGTKAPEPLTLHVAAGECVNVTLTNELATGRVSFHADKLERDWRSSGINAGFNPEQTVGPGGSRTYRLYADDDHIGTAIVSDYGFDDSGVKGLYGAIIVSPAGATFVDPVTGAPKDIGAQVDVRVPGEKDYRDFALFFSENDPVIGINTMPYPSAIAGPALVNYEGATPRALDAAQFSSLTHGDPRTPLLRAYPGDEMRVHVVGAPGGEQGHVFNLGGHTWAWDEHIPGSEQFSNQLFGPLSTLDAHVKGGAGRAGDYFYGNIRRPFTDAGQWGLLRVYTPGTGSIRALASNPLPPLPPAARAKLSSLTLAKSISTKTITKSGIKFSLKGPNDIRILRVKLYRLGGKKPVLVGKALIKLSAKTKTSSLTVTPTGVIRGVWKPSVVIRKKLKAGKYRLDVQAGISASAFEPQTLRRGTRITAPPPGVRTK